MTRLLPDWITAYLQHEDNTEPPLTYQKWVATSVLSACLQRKCYLQYASAVYPNMYVVLVGPSGRCRKGTAMKPGGKLLREVGVNLAAESITREALIKELNASNDSFLKPDASGVIQHNSLTIYSEELTVFLGYNNMQLIMDLTDWYDCRESWTYRTKQSGTDEMSNIFVSLLGATTPALIQTAMPLDAVGGGLTSRMIFVYEEKKRKTVTRPMEGKDPELFDLLIQDLQNIAQTSGEFIATEAFWKMWDVWYMGQEKIPDDDGLKRLFEDSRFAGYVERRPIHLLKLSMIMNVSRKNGEMLLDIEDFNRALKQLEDTEKKMRYSFSGVGKSDIADITARVMATIQIRGSEGVTMGELLKLYYFDADKDTMFKVVSTLEVMKFCTHVYEGNVHRFTYRKGESVI